MDAATGAIAHLSATPLQAELSALALAPALPRLLQPSAAAATARASGSPGLTGEAAAALVLTGQWRSNRVEVASALNPGRPMLALDLEYAAAGADSGAEQMPRSLALMPLPGAVAGAGAPPAVALLASTQAGRLFAWQLQPATASGQQQQLQPPQPQQQPQQLQAGPCYSVRLSNLPVEMRAAEGPAAGPHGGGGGDGGGGYMYLHSSSGGAVLRPRAAALLRGGSSSTGSGGSSSSSGSGSGSGSGWLALEEQLEVVRVHGTEDAQVRPLPAPVPLSCPWVTRAPDLAHSQLLPSISSHPHLPSCLSIPSSPPSLPT